MGNAKGELGRQITHASETERREGRCVKGRQLLHLVYQYYRIDEAAGALHNIHDLWNVTFVEDNKMEGFLASWDALLAGMKRMPSDEDLEVIFLRQIRKSKALTIDVAQFDRAEPGNPDRSYEFLLRAARRYVERKRLESNRSAIAQAVSGTKPAAPAAKGKGGKGRGRDRSPSSRAGGVCFEFAKSGTCSRGDTCKYKHERNEGRGRSSSRGRGKGKGKGKGKSRSNSPGRSASPGGKVNKPCSFFQKGSCKFGNQCRFQHNPTAPAAGSGPGKKSESPKPKPKATAKAAAAPVAAARRHE